MSTFLNLNNTYAQFILLFLILRMTETAVSVYEEMFYFHRKL
jgi:hypothetical protein